MNDLSRRNLLGAAALLGLAATAAATHADAQTTEHDDVVQIWPGPPPGSTGTAIVRKIADQSKDPARPDRFVTGIARPVLVVHRPPHANGAAALIMPGGGYGFLSYDNEGVAQAAWLNARGVTAFILLYRLPSEGWTGRPDVPLQDAQRAMRVIRAGAARLGIRTDQVAVLGFSAGGHLAGSLATRHAESTYPPVDAADLLSARPDVAGLIYPVVSLDEPFTHIGSRDMLLGPGSSVSDQRARSVERRVDATTPPTFLVHAADDGLVPPANSIALFTALRAAQRPAALHVFEDGGHGFGTRLPATKSAAAWPSLFSSFANRQGVSL